MTKAIPMDVPEPFRFGHEKHPYLVKFKKSWEKRFTIARMEVLFETVDLGLFLIALGRQNEAIELLEFVTALVEPSENKNIWSPIGYGIVMLCREYRLSGDIERRTLHLDRIKRCGFVNCENFAYLDGFIDEHEKKIDNAQADSQKWGCQTLSRHSMNLIFLRETTEEGFLHSGRYDVQNLDRLIDKTLTQLAIKLK